MDINQTKPAEAKAELAKLKKQSIKVLDAQMGDSEQGSVLVITGDIPDRFYGVDLDIDFNIYSFCPPQMPIKAHVFLIWQIKGTKDQFNFCLETANEEGLKLLDYVSKTGAVAYKRPGSGAKIVFCGRYNQSQMQVVDATLAMARF